MGRKARAAKSKPLSPNVEGQCREASRQTLCGISVSKGTCVLLSVFVFSFGALLCAFLMKLTDRWELQVTAYFIATTATIASLFFISYVRTSADGVDATSPLDNHRTASSRHNRPLQASFKKSRRREDARPPALWVPDWTDAGPFLSNPNHDQDWFVLPHDKGQQLYVGSFPLPTPVHTSPPATSALMTFENVMVWPSPPPTPTGLVHL